MFVLPFFQLFCSVLCIADIIRPTMEKQKWEIFVFFMALPLIVSSCSCVETINDFVLDTKPAVRNQYKHLCCLPLANIFYHRHSRSSSMFGIGFFEILAALMFLLETSRDCPAVML